VRRELGTLRSRRSYRALRAAFVEGCRRDGFRVVQYAVQRDHIHLIAEARDEVRLTRGMQGLSIRIARAINRALERKGKVLGDRYHARALTTPRQVRNAVAYVANNVRHHSARYGQQHSSHAGVPARRLSGTSG